MSHDPVIEPAALPSLGSFRLLDVREPAAFEAGHPATAVRVPIEVWEAAAKAGETSFENVGYWERAIADLGVDGRIPAVAYDDGRMGRHDRPLGRVLTELDARNLMVTVPRRCCL